MAKEHPKTISQHGVALQVIQTDGAPQAIGTYSQAVLHGDIFFLSGQIGMHPKTKALVSSSFRDQAMQVFENIQAIVEASGQSLESTIKLTVFLTDLKYFNELNEVMRHFYSAPFPARSAVEVKALPKGALVEIEATVALHGAEGAPSIPVIHPKQHDAAFIALVGAAKKDVTLISVEQLQKQITTHAPIRIIDVRETHEWRKGHIAHAVHISKGTLERDIMHHFPKDQAIVVYCSGGYRSILAAQALQKMGYTHVRSLEGGYRAWLAKQSDR